MYKDEVQKKNEENLQRRFEQDSVPQFIQKYFINLESKSSSFICMQHTCQPALQE